MERDRSLQVYSLDGVQTLREYSRMEDAQHPCLSKAENEARVEQIDGFGVNLLAYNRKQDDKPAKQTQESISDARPHRHAQGAWPTPVLQIFCRYTSNCERPARLVTFVSRLELCLRLPSPAGYKYIHK